MFNMHTQEKSQENFSIYISEDPKIYSSSRRWNRIFEELPPLMSKVIYEHNLI